jgi:phospholipase/carboxylesterase
MSYEVALADPGLACGIGIMSGAIFDSLVPQLQPSFALSQLRVFISHGSADDTIPVSYAIAADQRLRALGIKPEFHIYDGMAHGINAASLQDLVTWLR